MNMEKLLPIEERNKLTRNVFQQPVIPKKWSQLDDKEKRDVIAAMLTGTHQHNKHQLEHQRHELIEQAIHYILWKDEYPVKGWGEMSHKEKMKLLEDESKKWNDKQLIDMLTSYAHNSHIEHFGDFYDAKK